MKLVPLDEMVVDTYDRLTEFVKNNHFAQLRFVSTRSLRRSFSVTSIVYKKEIECFALTPYLVSQSYLDTEQDDDYRKETVFDVAKRGIKDETDLLLLDMLELDPPEKVKNNDNTLDQMYFSKHIIYTEDFLGSLRKEINLKKPKNLPSVWVHRSLLSHIFEEQVPVDDVLKHHPHYYAYQRYRAFEANR